MATIRKEISIHTSVEIVWAAVRDFNAVHRLAPGFIADCKPDGDARVITFGNGMVARELLVGIDDEQRRLAYAITEGRTTHYNGAMQVFAAGEHQCKAVWTIDLLPNDLAGPVGAMVEMGAAVMKKTLEQNTQPG